MKRPAKNLICILLSIGVFLSSGCLSAQAVTQEEAESGVQRPIPSFVTAEMMKLDYITDGVENITVNTNGSWTVTGDFTLQFPEPITFDYRMACYDFLLDIGSTNGTSDFQLLCTSSADASEWVSYSEALFGSLLMVDDTGSVYVNLREDIGRAGEVFYGWDTDYQVDVRAMTFHIGTATTVEINGFYCADSYTGVTKDVNGDGVVNTADARDLLCATLGAPSGHLFGIDVDGNGVFDTADAREKLIQVLIA